MSWIDRLANTELEIRTGDGRSYRPLWKEAKRSRDYNVTGYNFMNVSGTLVKRGRPQGDQYDIVLYFTGDSHLATADDFSASADDNRFWTITHPLFGVSRVQPISLEDDRTQLNATVFRVKVWETITSNYPVERQYTDDAVKRTWLETCEAGTVNFAAQIPAPSGTLRKTMDATVTEIDGKLSKRFTTGATFSEFKTLVSKAKRDINDATSESTATIRSLINIINYPAETIGSVKERIAIFEEVMQTLVFTITGDFTSSVLLEATLSAAAGAMAYSIVSPSDTDYRIRTDVVFASDALRTSYEMYLQKLDELQALRSDEVDTFTPDDDVNRLLDDAMVVAQGNLFDFAFNAKQERVLQIEADSNPISLAHRFYGLDEEDENLSFFIDTNALSLDELIQIKAGRRVVYYV